MSNKSIFDENWDVIQSAIGALGAQFHRPFTEAPASEEEIKQIEKRLKVRIPKCLRTIYLHYGKLFIKGYTLPENNHHPFPHILYSGVIAWGLEEHLEYEEMLEEIRGSDDPFWHDHQNRLPIYCNEEGGLTVIQLEGDNAGAIYYLARAADQAGHNYYLAANFIEFLNNLFLLGLPDWEGDFFLPFTSSPTSGLEPYGDNAKKWRDYIGLDISELEEIKLD